MLLVKQIQIENQRTLPFCLISLLDKITKSEKTIRYCNFQAPELGSYLLFLQHNKETKSKNQLVHLVKRIVKNLEGYLEYPRYPIVIGISKEKNSLQKASQGYMEVNKAIHLGSKIYSDSPKLVYDYDDLEVYDLINQAQNNFLLQFVESNLNPLFEFDKENGGELLRTLEIFLSLKGKIEDTARALFVHRNTVKFRLSRIEELLNVNFKNKDTLLRLELSLKASKLL
jgi:DNA-binding PucR family transcriptional regulator